MPTDNELLLDYALSTDPAPIPISTAQVTNQARVNISPSASTPVYCNEIQVAVPVGSDAPSLFIPNTPVGSVNTNKWNPPTQLLQKGSELWAGLDTNQDYATFTYTCDSIDSLINYNLVFGVFGAVDGAVGDVEIGIRECSGTDPKNLTPKTGNFPLSKACPDFYLKNLVATTPDAPTVPSTDFADGAPIRLAWESNGTYFQLFMAGQTAPIYSGTATTCTLSGGVSRDTTFVLAASMTGSPGQDTPQDGYQPIYLYDSLTVSVSNPVLTPTSVTVSDTLDVTGTSTLGTTNTGALTSSSATVSGALQASSLATGGTLNVSGSATIGQATVNGTLNATGSASLNNLTVNGLSATSGPVSLFGGSGKLVNAEEDQNQYNSTNLYEVFTDGFVVAQVRSPGNSNDLSFAYACIQPCWGPDDGFWVTGGTVGSFDKSIGVMNNNPNAITLPVKAGTFFIYTYTNASNNQADSPVEIWWYPMGGPSSGEETIRMLPAEELADAPPPPTPPNFSALVDREEQAAAAATDFIDRLTEALQASLTDETRADLTRLLRRL